MESVGGMVTHPLSTLMGFARLNMAKKGWSGEMSPQGKSWCRKRFIHIGIPDREGLAELIIGFGRIGKAYPASRKFGNALTLAGGTASYFILRFASAGSP